MEDAQRLPSQTVKNFVVDAANSVVNAVKKVVNVVVRTGRNIGRLVQDALN